LIRLRINIEIDPEAVAELVSYGLGSMPAFLARLACVLGMTWNVAH